MQQEHLEKILLTGNEVVFADIDQETLGATLWDADAAVFTSGTYAWVAQGGNSIANAGNELQITYSDDADGADITLRNSSDLSTDLTGL